MASRSLLTPQFPAPNSQQRQGGASTGRNKVALRPGHSLMDWIRLGRSGKDLTGTGGKILNVTPEELAKHNKQEDAWIAVRGKVYNVTPYMDFHPGGVDELMRGVGKDGTQLFDEIHKWVNAESMLEKCFVGKLNTESPRKRGSSASRKSLTIPNGPAALPNLNGLKPPSGPTPPRHDWFQNDDRVTIVVYTKSKEMKPEHVIVDLKGRELLLTAFINDHTFTLHTELQAEVDSDYEVKVQQDTGKVDIMAQKTVSGKHWSSLGSPLSRNNTFISTKDRTIAYRQCKLLSVSPVTHDTKLLCVALPEGSRMSVPLGYHIHIRHEIEGVEVVRSYTVVSPSFSENEQDERVKQGKVFYLMIKIYQQGALTPWIGKLSEGDTLEVSDYDGNFLVSRLTNCSHLVMLAAGTGFTPMVRLIQEALVNDRNANRCLKLMFFNKKTEDILWKDQLDVLSKENVRFTVEYVLSEPDENWSGLTGRISEALLKSFIPTESETEKLLVCACGPTPFTKEAIRLSTDLGVSEDQFHAFLG
ncbi:cytochrome b5 reductase 4-like isoform X2 [Liolophura sinensis]|uniref:cytochrome b5 reductase 4-like isoform X2 n=1 Tax=Liolophura sinensis TaxID=3198878 RepID=UPI00315848CB